MDKHTKNEERFQQYLCDARFAFKVDEGIARLFWNGGVAYGAAVERQAAAD